MSNPKRWQWLAIGLLISNVVLLTLLIVRQPQATGKRVGPRAYIIETLGLSERQAAEYDELIEAHRPVLRARRREVATLRGQLYRGLRETAPGPAFDSLQQLIGRRYAAIDSLNYRHLEDIRALTTPDQAAAFEQLTGEVTELFGGRAGAVGKAESVGEARSRR